MRRLLAAVVLAVAASACVPAPPPAAILYGDSLVVAARPYLEAGVTVRAEVGASVCGWGRQMLSDAGRRPGVVVVAFVGNYPHPCHDGLSRYEAYLRDFRSVRAIFPAATRVVVALPPLTATSSNLDVVQAALDSGLPTVDAREVCCRASDGVHLAPEGSREYAAVLSEAW